MVFIIHNKNQLWCKPSHWLFFQQFPSITCPALVLHASTCCNPPICQPRQAVLQEKQLLHITALILHFYLKAKVQQNIIKSSLTLVTSRTNRRLTYFHFLTTSTICRRVISCQIQERKLIFPSTQFCSAARDISVALLCPSPTLYSGAKKKKVKQLSSLFFLFP